MTTQTTMIKVRCGAASDRGATRATNQDAWLAQSPVFLVADGMGGHHDGAEASRLTVDAFGALTGLPVVRPADLTSAVFAASQAVGGLPTGTGKGAAGSTVSGVCLAEQDGLACWLVFNAGDSRTYRLSGKVLEQITVDHTRVQSLVDRGSLEPHEARRHPMRNVITRAIGGGTGQTPALDQWLLVAAPGDRILVCSDGLTSELTDQLIAAVLMSVEDPQEAAATLVRRAVAASGRDNVTAVVVDALEVTSQRDVGGAHDETAPEDLGVAGSGDTLPDGDLFVDQVGDGQ